MPSNATALMTTNDTPDFWHEPAGKRLAGCLRTASGGFLMLCIVCIVVHRCNRREPVTHENPWLNNDPTRTVTDIKELDYNNLLIIYRDEEPRKALREFPRSTVMQTHDTPENFYEDYYEDIYEYFHD